jgi:hypothetical protein
MEQCCLVFLANIFIFPNSSIYHKTSHCEENSLCFEFWQWSSHKRNFAQYLVFYALCSAAKKIKGCLAITILLRGAFLLFFLAHFVRASAEKRSCFSSPSTNSNSPASAYINPYLEQEHPLCQPLVRAIKIPAAHTSELSIPTGTFIITEAPLEFCDSLNAHHMKLRRANRRARVAWNVLIGPWAKKNAFMWCAM